MNRTQRRAMERLAKKQKQTGVKPGEPDANQQLLMQTIQINRIDAVNRVIDSLFNMDIDKKTFRLGGLGGATGVITADSLVEIANAAIMAGILLPQEQQQQEQGTPEEEATKGGVLLTPEELKFQETIRLGEEALKRTDGQED